MSLETKERLLKQLDLVGLLFKDAQRMRVVRAHEKFAHTWWCQGVDEEVGLWAYSEKFILNNPTV